MKRPRSCRCSPKCPGWAIFEVNRHHAIEIEACEDCNGVSRERGLPAWTDDDVIALPVARRALADRLIGKRTCTSPGARRVARTQALREYDLRFALSIILMWTSHNEDDMPLRKIEDIATAALEAS